MFYKLTRKMIPVMLISLAASSPLKASIPFPASSLDSDDEMDLTGSSSVSHPLTPAQDAQLEQDITQLLAQAKKAPFTLKEIKTFQEASQSSTYPFFIQRIISKNHELVPETRVESEWLLEDLVQNNVPSHLKQSPTTDAMDLD